MFRIFVERKDAFKNEAQKIFSDISGFLGIESIKSVRFLNRYDVENVTEEVFNAAVNRIFSEAQSDKIFLQKIEIEKNEYPIAWEFLPGQFDSRSDSAEQCLLLLREGLADQGVKTETRAPLVKCAKIVLLNGNPSENEIKKIKNYLINPVDSREADWEIPKTLQIPLSEPEDIQIINGFTKFSREQLENFRIENALAMDFSDIKFLQSYFRRKKRDPSETEIRVLDTYWSDHCRHTTFNTVLKSIKIEKGEFSSVFDSSLKEYKSIRAQIAKKRGEKPITLMDMATIAAKYLKENGFLNDLEESEENNACSIVIDVHCTKPSECDEKWLLQFKNETHNHPTEIEPFGGAATCIGGAIRDPLSGRAWVYQAMRITGAADPTKPLSSTLNGKLPQLKIVREAAKGFSSYGNQIGLATGIVDEIYHPGFEAKRLELGAVIAAAPQNAVLRESPSVGDVVILIGGGTGRDGIGGATGSSKVHTQKSVETAAAEVQKGNAVEERKIQRLFRNAEVCRMIKKANDFGAGGVSVAVGELASGLEIDLDLVPKKYEGLNGTEIAISESQERMAVLVSADDAERFICEAQKENLCAVQIAKVTESKKLVMTWRKKTIVELDREFLDSAGAHHEANALIENPESAQKSPLVRPLESVEKILGECASATGDSAQKKPTVKMIFDAFLANISDLACCSRRGLCEMFDGSIGAASILFPFGGKFQGTPECAMAAKIPVLPPYETSTVSFMSYGYDPRIAQWSPWHGAQIAILSSLAKITAIGGRAFQSRLSFQEFFGRAVDEKSWGKPVAALLGALDAQNKTKIPAIGGKDSMSGTFENLNVPNTLVSFAVSSGTASEVSSGAFKKSGDFLYLVQTPYEKNLAPNFEIFEKNSEALYNLNRQEHIFAIYPIGAGGIAEAICKMSFGSKIGAAITAIPSSATALGFHRNVNNTIADLFTPLYGSFIVETALKLEDAPGFVNGTVIKIGFTQKPQTISFLMTGLNPLPAVEIPLCDLIFAYENTLSKVYPPICNFENEKNKKSSENLPEFAKKTHQSLLDLQKKAKENYPHKIFNIKNPEIRPKVLLPVFPGINCEYDMARAFDLNGADCKILVFKNNTREALRESIDELAREIQKTQIFALSGGFSLGDEPDGSGKFIANVLRQEKIAKNIMDLLENRDGLILGICNGFQALVKTGLLPYGKIFPQSSEENPTLTFNTIGRHISRIVRTKIVSAATPWAFHQSVIDGKTHFIPVSHGEGRIVINEDLAKKLFCSGQIFSQYVCEDGFPTLCEPENPNGSAFAIEGLLSPCGRILGKMAHNERTIGTEKNGSSRDSLKNVLPNAQNENESGCENIFAAGVDYFRK